MSDYDANAVLTTIFAIYAAIIVFTLIVVVVNYVLTGFAFMSFFKKVGVEPWIAWVPYYNQWKWLEVGGQQGWFVLLALIPYGGIATLVFLIISMYRTGIAFGKSGGFVVLGVFFPFIWAWILGSANEVYRPELITAAGYPLPLAGYGSVPMDQRGTNYPGGPAAPPPPA